MDPENPVVKLCAEGMRAEGEGRFDDARALFAQAWEASADHYDACVAAHFLARHQPTPEETLRWNQEALRRAELVGDDRVRGFHPSLYLNLGHSHERLGDHAEARRFYELAAAHTAELGGDRYGDTTRDAIARGRERVRAALGEG